MDNYPPNVNLRAIGVEEDYDYEPNEDDIYEEQRDLLEN